MKKKWCEMLVAVIFLDFKVITPSLVLNGTNILTYIPKIPHYIGYLSSYWYGMYFYLDIQSKLSYLNTNKNFNKGSMIKFMVFQVKQGDKLYLRFLRFKRSRKENE